MAKKGIEIEGVDGKWEALDPEYAWSETSYARIRDRKLLILRRLPEPPPMPELMVGDGVKHSSFEPICGVYIGESSSPDCVSISSLTGNIRYMNRENITHIIRDGTFIWQRES